MQEMIDCARITLVLYRRRAFTTKLEVRRAMWRAFDTAVRRKPLAGAADAVYGNSIDFRLKIIARGGSLGKKCFFCSLMLWVFHFFGVSVGRGGFFFKTPSQTTVLN